MNDNLEERLVATPPEQAERLDARVVLLTHYVPQYQLPVYQCLSQRIRDFRVLVSTEIEPNRKFTPRWDGLNVTVQKTWTFNRKWKHQAGFNDDLYVHVPRDTGRQLRKLNPDIVLSLELGFRSLGCSLYRMLNRSSRLILCTYMSEHTEQGRGGARETLRRFLMRRSDAITYNGPSCIEVLRTLGARRDTMFHFPYAANPAHVYSGELGRSDADARRFLYVGQMSQRKGVEPMLESLRSYARTHCDRQFRLTMAGDGPLRRSLEEVDNPPNFAVDFVGNIPAEQLGKTMSQHGALIFPTLADEWGLVVNEALQAGMPVIGSRLAQATTTLIEDDRNGWVYDPRDPRELEHALDRFFLTDEATLSQMRHTCRETVAHITPEWACRGVLDACRSVLESRNA